MTYDVVIHDVAKDAYRSIVEYLTLVSDGPSAAENFMSEFDNQVDLISRNPKLYSLSRIETLADLGYRVAFVNNYVMLYYAESGVVHIAHVFHQSQDYARYVS